MLTCFALAGDATAVGESVEGGIDDLHAAQAHHNLAPLCHRIADLRVDKPSGPILFT